MQDNSASPSAPVPVSWALTLLFGSQTISMLGANVVSFALIVWVYQVDEQAMDVLGIAAIGTAATVVMTPIAGLIADAFERTMVLLSTEVSRILMSSVGLYLLLTDSLEVWHVAAASFIAAAIDTTRLIALRALLPELVTRDALGRVTGIWGLCRAVPMLTAPLLAGVLIAWIAMPGPMVLDIALSFVAAVPLLALRRVARRRTPGRGVRFGRHLFREAAGGFLTVFRRRDLRHLVALTIAASITVEVTAMLLIPALMEARGLEETSLAMSLLPAGPLLGSIFMTWLGASATKQTSQLVVPSVAFALLLLAAAFATNVWVLIAIISSAAAAHVVLTTRTQTWIQNSTEHDVHGRVHALVLLARSVLQTGAFVIVGLLVDEALAPRLTPHGELAWLTPFIGRGQLGALSLCVGGFLVLFVATAAGVVRVDPPPGPSAPRE